MPDAIRLWATEFWHFVTILVVVLAWATPRTVCAQSLAPHLWGVDNTISALAISGKTLYIGGTFNRVGPSTGGVAVLPKSVAGGRKPFPSVTGYVYTVAEDGKGGWFLAGNFTAVGGVPRYSLAHVLADGTVAAWNPNPNRWASWLCVSGRTVYVMGFFATISGEPRQYLAALDVETGEATDWDPRSNGFAYPVAHAGNVLYVVGSFTSIGGQPRNNVAALDATTGDALPWNPDADAGVWCATMSSGRLLVGGSFTRIGGESRSLLAELDLSTGKATAWNPDVRGPSGAYVASMAETQGRLFVGGYFSSIGGVPRNGIAAMEPATGGVLPWDPQMSIVRGESDVSVMRADGRSLYVGGWFSDIGGQHRNFLAQIDAITGKASDWNPDPSNEVFAIAVGDSSVAIGGTFKSFGMIARRNLAAFDLESGEVLPWNPSPDGLIVYALTAAHGRIYAGGYFDHIGGQTRGNVAALDPVTGAAIPDWDASTNETVIALAADSSKVFVGGLFRTLAGAPRRYLGAVDAKTGKVLPWDPSPNDWVRGLALDSGTVYALGYFSTIGGLPRRKLAMIDATSGAVGPLSVTVDGHLNALAVDRGTLYVGGSFETVNGSPQRNAFACDAATGALRVWSPSPDGPREDYRSAELHAVAVQGDRVYLGGDFTIVGGEPRAALAAVNRGSGQALDWRPDPDQQVRAIVVADGMVYAGGYLQAAMNEPHAGLIGVSEAPTPPLDVPPGPRQFRLDLAAIQPNPVRSGASVRFWLPRESAVDLAVFDVQGRRVQDLGPDGTQVAGPHEARIEAASLPVGCYLVRLAAANEVRTQRLVVLK